MTPAPSMPMPATTFSVIAPPRGDCSATTPSDVGQKNALPKLYTVAASDDGHRALRVREQQQTRHRNQRRDREQAERREPMHQRACEQAQDQHDRHRIDQHPTGVDAEIGHRGREDRGDPAVRAELGDRERNHHERHDDEDRLAGRARPQAIADGQRGDEAPLDAVGPARTRAPARTP